MINLEMARKETTGKCIWGSCEGHKIELVIVGSAGEQFRRKYLFLKKGGDDWRHLMYITNLFTNEAH